MSKSQDMTLEFDGVSCQRGELAVRDLTLAIAAPAIVAVQGDREGELLMRIISLLELPDRGEVHIDGRSVSSLDDGERVTLRSKLFGFVFSAPYLLPELSLAENVAMPLFKLLHVEASEAQQRTEEALAFVGLDEGAGGSSAGELSWYEQQCAALARAIVHRPRVLVVDHADLNLSENEAAQFADIARRASEEFSLSLVIRPVHTMTLLPDDRLLRVHHGLVAEVSRTVVSSPESLS